jgi:hypothetical protein
MALQNEFMLYCFLQSRGLFAEMIFSHLICDPSFTYKTETLINVHNTAIHVKLARYGDLLSSARRRYFYVSA